MSESQPLLGDVSIAGLHDELQTWMQAADQVLGDRFYT
jgi:hypothetical protein